MLYVAAFNGGNIYRYTKASGYTASTLITSNGGLNRSAINGAKGRLYVSENYGSTINVYNSTTGAQLEAIPLGEAARGLAVNEENDTLYVASAQTGTGSGHPKGQPPGSDDRGAERRKDPERNGRSCGRRRNRRRAISNTAPTPTGEYNSKQNCEQATPYCSTGPSRRRFTVSKRNTSTATGWLSKTGNTAAKASAPTKPSPRRRTSPLWKPVPPPTRTRTSAQLNGSFEGTNEATSYFFEYGPSTTYTKTQPVAPAEESIGPTTGPTPISVQISGLAPQTTYHFRVVATNSKGTTVGNDESFTTLRRSAESSPCRPPA